MVSHIIDTMIFVRTIGFVFFTRILYPVFSWSNHTICRVVPLSFHFINQFLYFLSATSSNLYKKWWINKPGPPMSRFFHHLITPISYGFRPEKMIEKNPISHQKNKNAHIRIINILLSFHSLFCYFMNHFKKFL